MFTVFGRMLFNLLKIEPPKVIKLFVYFLLRDLHNLTIILGYERTEHVHFLLNELSCHTLQTYIILIVLIFWEKIFGDLNWPQYEHIKE